MNVISNTHTGQVVEWAGTIEEFNAASDPAQVGQWVLVGPLAGAMPEAEGTPVWPSLPATGTETPDPIPVVVTTAPAPVGEPVVAPPPAAPAAAPAPGAE